MNPIPRAAEKHIWIDPLTDLMWQADSPGIMDWHEAMGYAQSLSLAGFTDWRLPDAVELESLLDRKQLMEHTRYRAGMRSGIPFQDLGTYWSATTFKDHAQNAWVVMFDGGYVLSYAKQNRYHVRCVRAGFSKATDAGHDRKEQIPWENYH